MIELLLAGVAAAMAPADPAPLVIGEAYKLEALGEDRTINVILPPDYAENSDQEWPVVYVLDGGMAQDLMLVTGLERWNRLWGRSQSVIIVGIETKDRQRELLPPTMDLAEQAQYSTAGQSANFRDWIATTVKPMIEARYRDDGSAFLVGESAAGHFVLETWLEMPGLFDGYAAISPSMQWNGQALSKAAAAKSDGYSAPLYVSLANEGGATEAGALRLVESLDGKGSFCFSDRRADLQHANSLHGLLPEALQFLLPTDASWLEEYGLGLRCEKQGIDPVIR